MSPQTAPDQPRPPGRTGRPLGFDRAAALDQVMVLFWEHGYHAASMTMQEQATGLSRSSLLNTFGAKHELFLAALDRYQDLVDATLLTPLHAGGGMAAIDRFFATLAELKQARPGSRGCLIVNAAAELGSDDPQVRARFQRYRRRLLEAFLAALRTAAAAGALTDDQLQARAESLAALAVSVNWTASAAGPVTARRVADAARALVAQWPAAAAAARPPTWNEAP